MSAFEKFVHLLQWEMETPTNYGIWHLCFLALTIAATVLLVWRFRDASDRTVRRILLVIWIAMVILECYKQLVFSMSMEDGIARWEYQWYAFPFQFCSTPLYALPFVIFLKDGKVRDAVMTFFSGFSLFAGLAVMLYPNDVFISEIGINIQTMIHHGSQVAVGVFLVAYNRHRMNCKSFMGSLAVFGCFVVAAMLLNVVVHHGLVACGMADTTFNMFFISPYHDCTLPVLSAVDPLVPYPVFFLIYLLGFSVVSGIVYGIEKGILALVMKKNAHD